MKLVMVVYTCDPSAGERLEDLGSGDSDQPVMLKQPALASMERLVPMNE